jgi:hypothetical protein
MVSLIRAASVIQLGWFSPFSSSHLLVPALRRWVRGIPALR